LNLAIIRNSVANDYEKNKPTKLRNQLKDSKIEKLAFWEISCDTSLVVILVPTAHALTKEYNKVEKLIARTFIDRSADTLGEVVIVKRRRIAITF
jgi:hypothetical protein